ncbi:MAG: ferritin-like domain-containing protein, partial [Oscillospiraceae bacterium]|nr:ferritin-like domain-containing protein [Oscillospiraceae bacterium]
MAITKEERNVLRKAQQGELDAVKMYNALAKTVKDPKDAETFRQLAAEEGRHAAVFKEL